MTNSDDGGRQRVVSVVMNTISFIVNSYVYSVLVMCLLLYVSELCGVLNS